MHEAKRNEIQYGFGFEVINRGGSLPSGTVAVGVCHLSACLRHSKPVRKHSGGLGARSSTLGNNFRGLGQSLSIGVLGARLDQRLGISYNDPYFLGSGWSSSVSISGERNSENPIFTSRFADFGLQTQKPLNESKTKTLTLRYDYRQTRLTNLLIPQTRAK